MTKEIYNDFYRKHGAGVHTDPTRFIEVAKLCEGRVLDIGCGTGDLADFYNGEYQGGDISDVAIKLANNLKRENASFGVLDALKKDNIYNPRADTIVMCEFLEHIDDEGALFENIKKWASPNVRIIISVPNGNRVPDVNHLREFTVPELRARFSKLGRVRFHNWKGFKNRILMTVDLRQKTENPVALSMIIKDEETGLEDAILSCIGFVDNITIAIDNTSKDKSEEIAKRYADTLKHYDWNDDFSKARNFAQEGITEKWILVIDGHEYVEKYEGLEEALAQDVEGLMVKVNMEASDSFYTNRIFRSHLKWENPIHNTIPTKTIKKYNGLTIRHNLIKGQNIASRRTRTEQRDDMMPRLLKKEYKKNKNNTREIFYLARFYFTKGNFRKSLRLYKKYLRLSNLKGEKWYCCWEASICANALGKPLLALKFLKKANVLTPNRWEISKQMGITYMSFGQWEKAITFLNDSFKINTGDFSHCPEKKKKAETWDQIGFGFFQLKRHNEAKVAWEHAIEYETDKDKIRLNKKRIELIDRNIIK